MKVEVLVEIALVGALAVCGVWLAKESRTLRWQADSERDLADANQRLLFRSVTGIDVSGRFVYKVIPPGAKRFVIFGLRHATLQEDLSFWSGAAALLAKEANVHLIGFCDGTACAESVRNTNQSFIFPIIVYGQATPSQALLNADAEGRLLLLDGALKAIRRIRWREQGQTAPNIVKEVLQ